MNTVAAIEPRIADLRVTDSEITAFLVDGRNVSVPLAWSWRLPDATLSQRDHWELIGDGIGVHWPDVDEDISVEGMLHGVPAPRPAANSAWVSKSIQCLEQEYHRRYLTFAQEQALDAIHDLPSPMPCIQPFPLIILCWNVKQR